MRDQSQQYSVLMSVYIKDRAEWLEQAVSSMLKQTIPPSELVLVEDGAVSVDVSNLIEKLERELGDRLRIVQLDKNSGLGEALRRGALECRYERIARMDADDISVPDRIEKELDALYRHNLDMVGSNVAEFIDSPDNPVAITSLPLNDVEILKYSKRRNPFRHPPILMKRSKVLEAGNYNGRYPFFEDWDLFSRMLAIGCRANNIQEPLVYMRVSSDFYHRRGGVRYLSYAGKFKLGKLKSNYFSLWDFIASFVPQAIVCLLPNKIRSLVYIKLLRG